MLGVVIAHAAVLAFFTVPPPRQPAALPLCPCAPEMPLSVRVRRGPAAARDAPRANSGSSLGPSV